MYRSNSCGEPSPLLGRLLAPLGIARPHTCAQCIFLGIQTPFFVSAAQAADAHTRPLDTGNGTHPEMTTYAAGEVKRDKGLIIHQAPRATFIYLPTNLTHFPTEAYTPCTHYHPHS